MNDKLLRKKTQMEIAKYTGDDVSRLEAEYNSEKGAQLDEENEREYQLADKIRKIEETTKSVVIQRMEGKEKNKYPEKER